MFTDRETAALKRLAQEHMPLASSENVGASQQKNQGTEGQAIMRMLSRVTGPMQVVGGSALPPRDGRPAMRVGGVEADSELLEKTKHVRRKGELMMQFFARTGCGAWQIRTSSKSEIAHFCETAQQNEEPIPSTLFEAKRVPPKFILVDTY